MANFEIRTYAEFKLAAGDVRCRLLPTEYAAKPKGGVKIPVFAGFLDQGALYKYVGV